MSKSRRLSHEQHAPAAAIEGASVEIVFEATGRHLDAKKELFEALTASGYDDDEIEEMFEEYDQDGSHAIDFDEFCAMLESSYLD